MKPAVNKNILILISGLLWSGVGLLLLRIASGWFSRFSGRESVWDVSTGLLLGFVIAWFGFRKLAQKNADRIALYSDKVCIFAFQRWQSYFLILFMVALGVFMRHATFIPKTLLAPIYIGMGSALFLASFVYYKRLFT